MLIFDLPDLYDTSSEIGAGIGYFGLMGIRFMGAYKSSSEKAGATPVHLSAWSKGKY